jgi:hypothetical protein
MAAIESILFPSPRSVHRAGKSPSPELDARFRPSFINPIALHRLGNSLKNLSPGL